MTRLTCPFSSVRRAAVAVLIAALAAGTSLPAGAAEPAPPPGEVTLRRIVMPMAGPLSYSDDFGDARSGGRTHQGNDIMVGKGRPLVAVTDAQVRRVHYDDGGSEGNMLVLRDSDGWEYWYIHVNNDTPGTDDGLNPPLHAFPAGIERGVRVKAGQVVAFAGDSGNAENTGAHLHFEIHMPDRTAINPYPSLRVAQGFRYANHCGFDLNPARDPDEDAAPEAAWVLSSGGKVTPVGGAAFLGDTAAMRLNHPIVGIGAAPSGEGYWLVARDGGSFTFGDADYRGSTGDLVLNQPIVGMAPTPTGDGYWLVARDGGIFAFGDAGFHGSTGDRILAKPIVGMAAAADSDGYWLVAGDGGVFTFGSAAYHGSTPGLGLCQWPSAAGLVATTTGDGYWIAGTDGSFRPYGDATDTTLAATTDVIDAAVSSPVSTRSRRS